MKWWKAHHGIATDRKYAVLLRHIRTTVTDSNALRPVSNPRNEPDNIRRADILAVWVWLIDFASQNHPRGSIDGVEIDEISTSLDIADSTVESIIASFRWRGMIEGNLLSAFEKRQPPDDPTNAERQRRKRQKDKERNALRPVTALRNENSLSQDRDGDGDGSTLAVISTLSHTSTESVGRDGDANSSGNGTATASPDEPTDRPPNQSHVSNGKITEMSKLLHATMQNPLPDRPPRVRKPPDRDIVIRCLKAANGVPMESVAHLLRSLQQNLKIPEHGPRKYAWFESVIAEEFGGHA